MKLGLKFGGNTSFNGSMERGGKIGEKIDMIDGVIGEDCEEISYRKP